MCSKLMFCSALNTLITVTLQTYGAPVGVHVLSAVVLKQLKYTTTVDIQLAPTINWKM